MAAPHTTDPSIEWSTSALTILLHPLVVINISDHFTRTKAQRKGDTTTRVFGALIGQQNALSVEIFTSFEFIVKAENGRFIINTEEAKKKMASLKEVKMFSTYEILGFYSTTPTAARPSDDMYLHQQLVGGEVHESPLYLMLNTGADAVPGRGLPIQLFESEVRIVDGTATTVFVMCQYKVESGEAERISVDHVAHVSEATGSTVVSHLNSLQSASQMLRERLAVILDVLDQMRSGQAPMDHRLLRQINALVARLPSANSTEFNEDFIKEYNDVVLVTYMAVVTKGENATNEMVDKFNIAHEKNAAMGGGRRRMMGYGV